MHSWLRYAMYQNRLRSLLRRRCMLRTYLVSNLIAAHALRCTFRAFCDIPTRKKLVDAPGQLVRWPLKGGNATA